MMVGRLSDTAAFRAAFAAVATLDVDLETEGVRRVIAFGFDDLRLHRLGAACMTRNRASAQVTENAGLRFVGIARGYLKKGDHFEDIATYAGLRRDR